MHPRRVQPRPGSCLIDQRSPRRCGLSPAAWGRRSLELERTGCCSAGRAADVRGKDELWRP